MILGWFDPDSHEQMTQHKIPKAPTSTPVADQEELDLASTSSFSSSSTIMLALSSVLVLSGAFAVSYAFDARADAPAQAVVSTTFIV